MWKATGQAVEMCEGDYGVSLPISIEGVTFGENDAVQFRVSAESPKRNVFSETFNNIQNNTVEISLTESQTGLLPAGDYRYALDWYRNGVFMCNIIAAQPFKVVEKA